MSASDTIIDDRTHEKVLLLGLKGYQIIDSSTSGGSAVARAGLGAFVLGPVGLVAGLSAKKKYEVMLIFKDRQKIVRMTDWNFKEFLKFVAEHNIGPM